MHRQAWCTYSNVPMQHQRHSQQQRWKTVKHHSQDRQSHVALVMQGRSEASWGFKQQQRCIGIGRQEALEVQHSCAAIRTTQCECDLAALRCCTSCPLHLLSVIC
jgi:hypothetical protein